MSKFKKSCETCKYIDVSPDVVDRHNIYIALEYAHCEATHQRYFATTMRMHTCGNSAKLWEAKDKSVLKEYEESRPMGKLKKMLGLTGFKVKFK